jgi:O-antigen/teichoic acid export membrane protein
MARSGAGEVQGSKFKVQSLVIGHWSFVFLMSAFADMVSHALRLLGGVGRGARELAGSSLVKKSSLSVVDQAVVSGTNFATSVVLARFAVQEELGVYYLALSVLYFARGIQEQLVSAPYMIYCNRKQGRALAEYAGSALVHQCVVMAVTAALLCGALAVGILPQHVKGAFWLLTVAAPLFLFREFARQMLFAHLELARATMLDIAGVIVQLGLLLILTASGQLTVTATLATLAASSGIVTIGWLATTTRGFIASLPLAGRDWIGNWPFARWALASQLLSSTTPYVMPWVIAVTHGEAQTGLLGACSTLVGFPNMFLMGLCNFLSPRTAQAYAQGGLAELRGVLWKTTLLFGATLGSVAAAAFVFGEQIALLIYGPQFEGAGLIIGVLSLSVLANSIGVVAGNGLWAIERPSASFAADVCSLIVVVVAALVFVPLLGPLGAAIATLAGTASDAAIRLAILRISINELAAGEATR